MGEGWGGMGRMGRENPNFPLGGGGKTKVRNLPPHPPHPSHPPQVQKKKLKRINYYLIIALGCRDRKSVPLVGHSTTKLT